jgi:hypothetical protein
MTQLSNVLIVLLSVIKTFDNCVISKAVVWAIIISRPLNPRNRLKVPLSLENNNLPSPIRPIPRESFPVGELPSQAHTPTYIASL